MNILVVGQGGREHALAWKLARSKRVDSLYCAPGNGGTSGLAKNIPIKADDIDGLADFCKKERIDLTVVGPETPLALGIVDRFNTEGLRIFGPSKAASQLEASKIFTKKLCKRKKIPTAWFETFEDAGKARDFIRLKGAPIVIKADGLAQGKGVIVAKTEKEACDAVDAILVEKRFGSSGDRLIVEECLEGEEASIIVISDGKNIVPLASSQDHKRALDGDKGPNTGGMGAYSPAPVVTEAIFETTIEKIIKPAIEGMQEAGTPLKGVLYAGIMVTGGGPKLLEFNVRFGDPETEAIIPRLKSDIVDLIEGSIDGSLENHKLKWDKRCCVSVVMASGGYPGKYEKGKEIKGLDEALSLEETTIFHAGTKKTGGKVVTDGGRVLNVVSLGSDIKEAIERAYKACGRIDFTNAYYRRDIGHRALMCAKPKIKNLK
ncbi:MAG: phosphoribosylamine--glycine ligase [Candidatus Omnitrophota bacterium]